MYRQFVDWSTIKCYFKEDYIFCTPICTPAKEKVKYMSGSRRLQVRLKERDFRLLVDHERKLAETEGRKPNLSAFVQGLIYKSVQTICEQDRKLYRQSGQRMEYEPGIVLQPESDEDIIARVLAEYKSKNPQ